MRLFFGFALTFFLFSTTPKGFAGDSVSPCDFNPKGRNWTMTCNRPGGGKTSIEFLHVPIPNPADPSHPKIAFRAVCVATCWVNTPMTFTPCADKTDIPITNPCNAPIKNEVPKNYQTEAAAVNGNIRQVCEEFTEIVCAAGPYQTFGSCQPLAPASCFKKAK